MTWTNYLLFNYIICIIKIPPKTTYIICMYVLCSDTWICDSMRIILYYTYSHAVGWKFNCFAVELIRVRMYIFRKSCQLSLRIVWYTYILFHYTLSPNFPPAGRWIFHVWSISFEYILAVIVTSRSLQAQTLSRAPRHLNIKMKI